MIIRINLLGPEVRMRWRKNRLISGVITLGLVLLLTIGLFRLLRMFQEHPIVHQEMASTSETVEIDTMSVPAPTTTTNTAAGSTPSETIPAPIPTTGTAIDSPGQSIPRWQSTSHPESVVKMIQETLPPFVWFSSLQSSAKGDYTIEGMAFSSYRAQEFLGRLQQTSALCEMPAPMSIQEDTHGHKTFRFTICGTMRGQPARPSFPPVIPTKEELSRLTNRSLSEGHNHQITFLVTPTWEEQSLEGKLRKRGTFQVAGRYHRVVAWLQELERLYGRNSLSSFSIASGEESGGSDTVNLVATVDVIVQQ